MSGDKNIVRLQKVSSFTLIGLLVCVILWAGYDFFHADNSTYRKDSTPRPKESIEIPKEKTHTPGITEEDRLLIDSQDRKKKLKRTFINEPKLKYKASQVIDLGQISPENRKVNAMGTIVRAKLITSLDTREEGQICKAMITDKGVSFLPYKSLIFGKARLGGSQKALIVFDHALLPTGEELPIQAQAMSLKDDSLGVAGDFHGKMGTRAATTIGLTMISGMGEVLTEKESFGGFQGNIVAKPSLKNALYNGIAKATESEAQRQSENLSQSPEYLTVKSGTEFNVQLLTKIKEETIE